MQPYESDSRPLEPCIVKLDGGDTIADEFVNSVNVFQALPDRAARILGDAAYERNAQGERSGTMRLEVAGACWNVPELAQGPGNFLPTFKDLLLCVGEQTLLGGTPPAGDVRPFSNMNSILAETIGQGGVVSSLRKGGDGLRRTSGKPSGPGAEPALPWGWYTLEDKDTQFDLYHAKKGEYPPGQAMRRMYRKHFGGDLPDLKSLVQAQVKPQLETFVTDCRTKGFLPIIARTHGDLNAANSMVSSWPSSRTAGRRTSSQ